MAWIDLAQNRGQAADSCEYDNKPSVSINCEELLDSLRTC
jgi:hypothetical protein